MIPQDGRGAGAPAGRHPLADGLARLLQAYAYALDAEAVVWDFAVEVESLYAAGLTTCDLRWLVARRYAEHARETSVYGAAHRTFAPGSGFFFAGPTCVVLTAAGAAFAADTVRGAAPPAARPAPVAAPAPAPRPHWDPALRVLSLDGAVVKRYRVPAQNQELILGAFQEEGWPEHVDDPLPVSGAVDPMTRLHDAINKLNARQAAPLLRFRGNGRGDGVLWEARSAAPHLHAPAPCV